MYNVSKKPVKSRASMAFENGVKSPVILNFKDDKIILEKKKHFLGSEYRKIPLPFFVSENRQKSGFKKYNHFLKKFFPQILKGDENLEGKCH